MTANNSDTLLIPPSIVGGTMGGDDKPIIVYERDHLRLRCAANGVPKPDIEWARQDGRTINTGSWEGKYSISFVLIPTSRHL